MVEKGPSGFTLLELLWVMLILSVVLTAVIPHFSGALFQMGAQNKARQVLMALTFSQQQAINTSNTLGVFFDLTEGNQLLSCYRKKGYEESGEPIIDANNILINPLTKKGYSIKFDQEDDYNNVEIQEANFRGNHWVEFNSLGDPNFAGQIILEGGSITHTISISRIGRITFE